MLRDTHLIYIFLTFKKLTLFLLSHRLSEERDVWAMLLMFKVSVLLRNRWRESFKTCGSSLGLGEKDACGGGGGGGNCWLSLLLWWEEVSLWWKMKSFFSCHCWRLKGNFLCFLIVFFSCLILEINIITKREICFVCVVVCCGVFLDCRTDFF